MRDLGRAIRKLFPAFLFVAAALFLYEAGTIAGWRSIGDRLAAARPGILALAVIANLLGTVAWAARWKLLLAPVARAPISSAWRTLMASVFVNTVVPFARSVGGFVRAGYLSRALGEALGPIYGATLADQVGYSVMSVTLGALTVPFVLWPGPRTGGAVVALLVGAAAVLGILVLFRSPGRRASLIGWLQKRTSGMPLFLGAARSAEGSVSAARRVLSRPGSYAVIAAGGLAVWSANVLTFVIAGWAIGEQIGFSAAAAAWSLGSVVGVASGTPGGAGTTESAAIVPLVSFGVPPEGALATVFLARGIQYFVGLTVGGVCLLSCQRDRRGVARVIPSRS